MSAEPIEVGTQIDGIRVRTRVAPEFEQLARTVVDVMTKDGFRQDDDGNVGVERWQGRMAAGTPMWWGFSEATPVADDAGYTLVTPHFLADPPVRRDDLTPLLEHRQRMLEVCASAGVPPEWTAASDRVILARGWETADELFMVRDSPTPGDSGWFVQPVSMVPPDEGWRPEDLEARSAWMLLRSRPELVWAMALPEDSVVRARPGRIVAIMGAGGTLLAENLDLSSRA